jgi:2,5-furandicarboxylate decarboxylase 1
MKKFTQLRPWLAHLADTGRLLATKKNIALKHELAAIAKKMDGKSGVLFPGPGGHSIPVVSGFMSSRSWIAEAMGVEESSLLNAFRLAADNPISCKLVKNAPCQEVVHQDFDMRTLLPVPTHSEHDSGPYITAGLVIAKNPKTGIQNVSINRIQVNSKDRMAVLILPRHLHSFQQAAEELNQPLPVAVVIGVDPLTLLASQAIAPIDSDELEIAGALHGEALEVAQCLTNGVWVPANAEIVLEGHIPPKVRELEGPFGEYPKYYSSQEKRQVIVVDTVTHRKDPIFHTIVPAELEHLLLGSIPREATILSYLRRSFPGVLDVHLSLGGVGRYHLYVQIKKTHEGLPKNVIAGTFSSHYDVKHVVIVDEDVDVHDPSQVEWAIATRFQAKRGLVVIHDAQGSVLDPSTTVGLPVDENGVIPAHYQGMSSKLGLDATKPLVYEGHVFTKVKIPGEDEVNLDAVLDTQFPLSSYLKSN